MPYVLTDPPQNKVRQDARQISSLRVHIALLICSLSFINLCHCIKRLQISFNICLRSKLKCTPEDPYVDNKRKD
jgi:hypothetical protein